MQLEKKEESKNFVTILSDGKFHQQVPEGTEGAIVREYEASNGDKGVKTELVYDEVSGKITNLTFQEGDFGQNLLVEIDGDGVVLMATSGPFAEDFMKKVKSIDLSKEVKLVPYSFEDEKSKSKKGITVYQDENKIQNYYYDISNKKSINGIPEPEGDTSTYDSDDWKMHFIRIRKFLIKEVEGIKFD